MRFKDFLSYFLLLIFKPSSPKTMEWRMLRLLNKDRKAHRLEPVFMQDDLRKVARKHSTDMARKDFFDHVNMSGEKPSDRMVWSCVSYVTSGENLAKIGGHRNPTQVADTGLMNSPGHRANILESRFNAVGIGVVRDERGVYYFTQNFAHRDLIFKGKIPVSASVSGGLVLRGKCFTDARHIHFRVTYPKSPKVLHEGGCDVSDDLFHIRIPFSRPGIYEVFLYVDHEGHGQYTLANRFKLKVRRFWFLPF